MISEDKNSSQLSSVTNALRILKSFSNTQPVRRVSELAEELHVSKSTISRIVQTLVGEGFLVRDSGTAGYRLGYAILTLGGMLANDNELYREVAPVLNDIVLQTGESAHVAVMINNDIVYLNKNTGPYYADIKTQVGEHNPAHATSSGKVLLAYADDKTVEELLGRGLEAYTENTIVNPLRFRQELVKVRQQGYAVSMEEMTKNNYSLAVPVRNMDGQVVCAIVVVGPISRLNKNKLQQFITLLKDAADEASERLGFGG